MNNEEGKASEAASTLNDRLGERFAPLLDYLYAKEMGGWGWGVKYDSQVTDGKMSEDAKLAYLKGHYSMLLNLAVELIPPAYIKELQQDRIA